jgi:hypothetical protein
VTTLEQGAFSRAALEHFVLPASVESIANFCFLDCDQLYRIAIPESSALVSIGALIIRHTHIDEFMIPAGVKAIAGAAFAHCPLQSIRIAPGNSAFLLKGDFLIEKQTGRLIEWFGLLPALILPPMIRAIASSAFDGSPLRSLTIVDSVVDINPDAFAGLDLDVLVLPASCEMMGFHFAKCTVRSVLVSGEGPLHVKEQLLLWDQQLVRHLGKGKLLEIPADITSLGRGCFFEDTHTCQVNFPAKSALREICEVAFRFSSVEHVVIPETVKIIKRAAFTQCTSLVAVEFRSPAELVTIEDMAFSGAGLLSVCIPQSVTLIGEAAFAHSKSLSSIAWEGDPQVRVFSTRMFTRAALIAVTIPRSVEVIGDSCFCDCFRLNQVEFARDGHLRRIGAHAFENIRARIMEVPSTVDVIGDAGIVCTVIVADETDVELVQWAAARVSNLKLSFTRAGG